MDSPNELLLPVPCRSHSQLQQPARVGMYVVRRHKLLQHISQRRSSRFITPAA